MPTPAQLRRSRIHYPETYRQHKTLKRVVLDPPVIPAFDPNKRPRPKVLADGTFGVDRRESIKHITKSLSATFGMHGETDSPEYLRQWTYSLAEERPFDGGPVTYRVWIAKADGNKLTPLNPTGLGHAHRERAAELANIAFAFLMMAMTYMLQNQPPAKLRETLEYNFPRTILEARYWRRFCTALQNLGAK
jgi:hypothetical protein